MSEWKEEEERETCVGAELEIAGATFNVLVDRVVEMAIEDFLGKRERAVEARESEKREKRKRKTTYRSRTTARLSSIR